MQPQDYWFHSNAVYIVNTVLASLQILLVGGTSIYFTRRVVRSTLSGKRWSRRRLRGAQFSAVELSLQLINSCLFLIPNARALAKDCTWFSPLTIWTSFGSWTIWNTFFLLFIVQASNLLPMQPGQTWRTPFQPKGFGKPPEPKIYLDAPLWVHWPKLGLWVTMEGLLLGLSIDLAQNPTSSQVPGQAPLAPGQSCRNAHYTCSFSTTGEVLSSLVAATAISYLLVYVSYIYKSFRVFYNLPYAPFRMGNLILRLQLRQRSVAFTFFIATIICYFYVRHGSCGSYVLSWYGFTPMQLVMTVVACTQGYLSAPKKPEQAAILQVWLQEFAWAERDVPRKRVERVSSLPEDSFVGFCMDCEPLFCFETAIKLMHWAFLAYDSGELPGSPFSSATALGLFDLTHFDVVWEKALNTKAVIGWREDPAVVVIAFRGTASASNLFADLQAWRTRYPKGVGHPLLSTAPMVHVGFLKAYTRNAFNDRLLGKVNHILNRCQLASSTPSTTPVKVYLTGHSLGGALAMLCAYDVATRTPCADFDIDISCYTFGAPRVGNHAWARLYNNKVPDTWTLINSDDVITRAGKFFFLFKHVGHRVLLNRRGDLVVRPLFVEYSIRRSPGGSLKDHYLTSYERAVVAVVAAQFGTKALGEKEEVVALAESAQIQAVLRQAGLSVEDVKRLEEGTGELAPQRLRRGVSERRGAAAARRVSILARCMEFVEKASSRISGRHTLEPIAMMGDSSGSREGTTEAARSEIGTADISEIGTAEEGLRVTEKVSPSGRVEEGLEREAVDEEALQGPVSSPGPVEDRVEARLYADSGLHLCQVMCNRMGSPKGRCSYQNNKKRGSSSAQQQDVSVDRASAPSRMVTLSKIEEGKGKNSDT